MRWVSLSFRTAAAVLIALAFTSCGGSGSAPTDSPSAAEPASEDAVVVTMSGGCDRPQPELGTEALALVRVTYRDGSPVVDAEVRGEVEGPGVVRDTAADATYLNGEALLLFPVTLPGPYTMSVVSITLVNGLPAEFDTSSTLSTTYDIGERCVPP